jgi:hypothetical protein
MTDGAVFDHALTDQPQGGTGQTKEIVLRIDNDQAHLAISSGLLG